MNWFLDKPGVFSFAYGRSESYGTILTNPFTQKRISLTSDQSQILALLDGKRTPLTILFSLLKNTGLGLIPFLNTFRQIRTTLDILTEGLLLCANPVKSGEQVRLACPRDVPSGWSSAPDAVTWEISRVCNLRCRHCLTAAPYKEDITNLTDDLVFADFMPVINALQEMGIFSVTLTGGEPLLHPKILAILDALNNAGICADIATNGYAVSDSLSSELANRRISSIQVSIDGFAEFHDDFRGVPGAFNGSIKSLERFSDLGFNTSISTTVTPKNLELLPSLVALAYQKGCATYKAIPMMCAGRATHPDSPSGLSGNELRRFATLIQNLDKQYKGRMEIYTASAMMHLLGDQPVAPSDRDDLTATPMGCAAGKSTLNIGVDGSISPCPFLRTHRLGNLLERPLWEIWDSSPTLQELRSLTLADFPEACQSCGHAGISCAGGCRASAYSKTDSLCGKDPSCFSS